MKSGIKPIDKSEVLYSYLLIILMGILVFMKPLGNSDELWNYNFAHNILDGKLPYKDFSIVQTPLSCYVSAFFMFFFGKGLFTFKILTFILFVATSILVFDLSKKVTENQFVALGAMAISMSAHFLCYIYNYNYLTALVILIILEIEYKANDALKTHFLLGFLVGITILIKQNTGLFIWIANFIICIWNYRKNRKNFKSYFGRLLASVLPFLFYLIYLVCVGCLRDFIDYAVYGVTTFTHRYTLVDFCVEATIFIPYLVLIIIMFSVMGVKAYRRSLTNFQLTSGLFSLAWASIMFPLADPCHVMSVLIPLTPAFLSFILLREIKWKKRTKEIVLAIFVGVFMGQCVCTFSLPYGVDFHISVLNNYKGIFMDEKAEAVIQEVDEYILDKEREGYRVRIADVSGVVYKIPLDNYEKNWDMLLVGNLGSNTVEDLMHSDKPTLYLLIKDEELYGLQDHYEVLDYIKTNYRRVDEIKGFDVYESNEKDIK